MSRRAHASRRTLGPHLGPRLGPGPHDRDQRWEQTNDAPPPLEHSSPAQRQLDERMFISGDAPGARGRWPSKSGPHHAWVGAALRRLRDELVGESEGGEHLLQCGGELSGGLLHHQDAQDGSAINAFGDQLLGPLTIDDPVDHDGR